jgi:hypothetical protein
MLLGSYTVKEVKMLLGSYTVKEVKMLLGNYTVEEVKMLLGSYTVKEVKIIKNYKTILVILCRKGSCESARSRHVRTVCGYAVWINIKQDRQFL